MSIDYPIVLSALRGTGPSERFTQNIASSPLALNKHHRIALKLLSVTNSWNTISAAIGNNEFHYIDLALNLRLVTIPDGQYTITELNVTLFNTMVANGDAVLPPAPLELIPLFTQGRVEARVNIPGYQFSFGGHTFRDIIGFNGVGVVAVTTIGPDRANAGNSIDGLLVGCNLALGSNINPNSSNVVAQLPITSGPSTTINYKPNELTFMPVSEGVHNHITVTLTDTLGRSAPNFSLNGEAFSVEFIIRELVH